MYPIIKVGDAYEVSSGISKNAESFGKGNPFLSFKTVFNNFFVPEKIGRMNRENILIF